MKPINEQAFSYKCQAQLYIIGPKERHNRRDVMRHDQDVCLHNIGHLSES